jgi:hypothetical protein
MINFNEYIDFFLKDDKKFIINGKKCSELEYYRYNRKQYLYKEMNVDQVYESWVWRKRFAKRNRYDRNKYVITTPYKEHNIEDFGDFCKYITKYEQTRII